MYTNLVIDGWANGQVENFMPPAGRVYLDWQRPNNNNNGNNNQSSASSWCFCTTLLLMTTLLIVIQHFFLNSTIQHLESIHLRIYNFIMTVHINNINMMMMMTMIDDDE